MGASGSSVDASSPRTKRDITQLGGLFPASLLRELKGGEQDQSGVLPAILSERSGLHKQIQNMEVASSSPDTIAHPLCATSIATCKRLGLPSAARQLMSVVVDAAQEMEIGSSKIEGVLFRLRAAERRG